MEIIQEIGSYAGFAAVLGLAVLSALYFSQARDVKRLREWAGRAPERTTAPTPAAQTQRVVAQPIARPQPGKPGPAVPKPPAPPAASPVASPAQAAAAGAAPAVAKGPAPATPAGAQTPPEKPDADGDDGGAGDDVTALDTVVHEPPRPDDDPASDEANADEATSRENGDEPDAPEADGAAAATPAPEDDDEPEAASEGAAEPEPGEPVGEDTGEWSPEDEHSDYDFTEEHDALTPPPAPPRPPQPFPRRSGVTPAARTGRGTILPPYAESRPAAEPERAPRSRRPVLIALAAALALALAVGVFAVLQVTGGEDSGGGQDAGLSATPADGGTGGGDGASSAPIDPSTVTVAVLNGTTQPGLAAQIGDQIAGEGFVRGVVTNNSDQTRAESVVLYAPGAEREAIDVSRRLDIPQREPIDSASQTLAGDATVVVIAGADQIQ